MKSSMTTFGGRRTALPQLRGLGAGRRRDHDVRPVLERLERGHDQLRRVGVVDRPLRHGHHLRAPGRGPPAGSDVSDRSARAGGHESVPRTRRCPGGGSRGTPAPGEPLRNTRRALAIGACGNPSRGIGAMPWLARIVVVGEHAAPSWCSRACVARRRARSCPRMVRAGRRPKNGGGLCVVGHHHASARPRTRVRRGARRPASRRTSLRRRRTRRTRNSRPDVHDVVEVVVHAGDEELLKVERDQLGPLQGGALWVQVVEIAGLSPLSLAGYGNQGMSSSVDLEAILRARRTSARRGRGRRMTWTAIPVSGLKWPSAGKDASKILMTFSCFYLRSDYSDSL